MSLHTSGSLAGRRGMQLVMIGLSLAVGARFAGAQVAPAPAADAQFQIAPRGYVQFDWRGFPDWTVAPGTGRLSRSAFEVRRMRFGIDGRWRRVQYELTVDPQDNDGIFLRDAYGQVQLPGAFRLRVGQFKVPGSVEYGESARTLDMMERAAFVMTVAPGRDVGVMVSRDLGSAIEFDAGVFLGDGTGRGSRSGVMSAGRLVWTARRGLDLGASFSEGAVRAQDDQPANGFIGRSTVWYRFFERTYVNGRRVRVGGDAEWDRGPWRLSAEVLRARDDRSGQGLDLENLPGVVALGWSAAVRREFGRQGGGARSRRREVDLTFRLDGLSFDDTAPPTGRDSVRPRATDVRARGVTTATTGVSWAPSRWARVLTNVAWERYSDTRSAPNPGRRDYWTAGTRFQLELP